MKFKIEIVRKDLANKLNFTHNITLYSWEALEVFFQFAKLFHEALKITEVNIMLEKEESGV
jgi:hypothetical protein